MRNERIVISRQRLLDEVWGYDPFSMTNTIEVFVSNLRRKLEAGGEPRLLHTIRGAGYVLGRRRPPRLPAPAAAARRLPIRWRLAGGVRGLTLVILLGFALVVATLTTRRIHADFNGEVARPPTELRSDLGGLRRRWPGASACRRCDSTPPRRRRCASSRSTARVNCHDAERAELGPPTVGARRNRRLPRSRRAARLRSAAAARRSLLRPVRAPDLGTSQATANARAASSWPRRARRRRARAAGRPGHRPPRDGADRAS